MQLLDFHIYIMLSAYKTMYMYTILFGHPNNFVKKAISYYHYAR